MSNPSNAREPVEDSGDSKSSSSTIPYPPVPRIGNKSFDLLVGNHEGQMAVNAIKTIRLSGLLKDSESPAVFNQARRVRYSRELMTAFEPPDERTINGNPPPNPRPNLPQRANHVLDMTLGPIIGEGGTGFVHDVTVGGEHAQHLPALVAKIALPRQRAALSQEAWFYSDMLIAQGSVIPLCYGYFEFTLPSGVELGVAAHKQCEEAVQKGDPGYRRTREPVIPQRFGLLLLEKLTVEHLPTWDDMTDRWVIDINALIVEFSNLFVHYGDLRKENIVRVVPSDKPEVPRRRMPTTRRISPWRIVDLEHCVKHNMRLKSHLRCRQTENLDGLWVSLEA